MLDTLSIALIIFLAIYVAKDLYLVTKLRNYREKAKISIKEKGNSDSIIEQANDAILVIDIVDGRIHQANPSAAALLGYTKEQLLSKSLFDLHPKKCLERSSSVVADVWEKGGLIYNDIPFLTSTGELLPVECSAKVAPFAGRPAIVIYARDIRERLRMEMKIQTQNSVIEEKNKDITDSINYARRIQAAILPEKSMLKKNVADAFVFYKPKDIVSGDFYWFSNTDTDWLVVAAVDCTGHGVPGALMSMIGSNILNEVKRNPEINKPSQVLAYLDERVLSTLKRGGADDVNDGMDIVFCAISAKEKMLEYAGANRPLVIIRDGKAMEYKPTKLSIGGDSLSTQKNFTDTRVELQSGDCIYLFTDGYPDQFGGPEKKKFMYRNLINLLVKISPEPMSAQKQILEKTIIEWQGGREQIDDILVIGIRV